jgi:DNA-binding SARP family transcriptional activator
VSVALLWLKSLLAAVVSLAALPVLWSFRPGFPALPAALSSPVTTTLLQQLALVAAWLLAAFFTLLLLVQSMRGMRARRRLGPGVAWDALTTDSARPRRSVDTLAVPLPLGGEPRLLVVAPQEAPPPQPDAETVRSARKPTGRTAAEPDERPLISLLGPLAIHGGKRTRRGLRHRSLELIAFLALRCEGAQRDEILEALWPGEDPKRSRHRLYQAVRDARRLIGDAVASERDRYWLDRGHVRVDADQLEDLLEKARSASRGQDSEEPLEKALSLFRGEPLAGCDYAWSESDIRSLRATYVELLERVGSARLKGGKARDALEAAERGITVDVLNEGLWRLALEAEGNLGLREAIAQRYEHLSRLLNERLGLQPQRETRVLYRRLLSQR